MSSLGECNPPQKTEEGNTLAMVYEEKKSPAFIFPFLKSKAASACGYPIQTQPELAKIPLEKLLSQESS